MLDWITRVAATIRQNLSWSPIPEAQKEAIVADEIDKCENPPVKTDTRSPRWMKENAEEEDDPLMSSGEKFSDLRNRARKEWEPWLQ